MKPEVCWLSYREFSSAAKPPHSLQGGWLNPYFNNGIASSTYCSSPGNTALVEHDKRTQSTVDGMGD